MITLEEQRVRYLFNLARNLYKGGLAVEGRMHEIVAVKTGTLDADISTDQPIIRKYVISVDIGNSGKLGYAPIVEAGVKNKTFNYHRNGTVVYSGAGQHYQARALEDTKDDVMNILKSTRS